MYLMLGTRPDIAYAICKLAQYSAHLSTRHWMGIIRILRYLRSHDSVYLTLGKTDIPRNPTPTPVPISLVGYFDASLMDCVKSRKSTGVYVFFLHGALISWASKQQGLVALSSTEAAGTEAARELVWIMSFLENVINGAIIQELPTSPMWEMLWRLPNEKPTVYSHQETIPLCG